MSEQENIRQRIYDLLNAETEPEFLCQPYTKERNIFLQKKNFFRSRGSDRLNKRRKESFLTALVTVIKKDPTTSIRKQANELKVHEKTEDTN